MVRNSRAPGWRRRALLAAVLMSGTGAVASTPNTADNALCILPFAKCGPADPDGSEARGSKVNSDGRKASIPLPSRALLVPQAQPDCEYRATPGGSDDARIKLDYERQCYRHYEMIARQRLLLLQASVERTIRAVRRAEQSAQ
jgi:hypothetical protein